MGRGGARLSVVMVGSKGALLSRIQQVVRALGQTTRASAATVRAVVDVGGAGRRSSVQIRQEQGQCNYKLARRWVTSPTGRVTPFGSFDGTCHAALSSSGRIRCHVSAAAVVPRITFSPLRRSTLAVPGRRWLTGGAVAHWVTLPDRESHVSFRAVYPVTASPSKDAEIAAIMRLAFLIGTCYKCTRLTPAPARSRARGAGPPRRCCSGRG
jgi:hypothetical protein